MIYIGLVLCSSAQGALLHPLEMIIFCLLTLAVWASITETFCVVFDSIKCLKRDTVRIRTLHWFYHRVQIYICKNIFFTP